MAGLYTQFKVYTAGEVLTAADLNATDVNHITNQIPQSTDDYSQDLSQSREQVSPATLATSLAGEITRLRYVIAKLAGKQFWDQVSSGGAITQTFRGLRLRTHPDASLAAGRVSLIHADEIIMDDGSKYLDWNNVTAIIAAVGAGGLDTGSEVANEWYEIYAIGSSGTGSRNLLLHRAKSYIDDQEQAVATSFHKIRDVTANTKLAQGITPAATAKREFILLRIRKVGAPTGRIWVTLETDSAGSPSGTALMTSDKLDVALLSTSTIPVLFPFRSPTSLTASTQYHIVLNGDWTISAVNHAEWAGDSVNSYAGGVGKKFDGATWTPTVGVLDFSFTDTRIANDLAVTMPSGFDQKCLIGYVRNNSSLNFVAFDQFGRKVINLVVETISTSITTTIPAIVDIATILPPRLVVLEIYGSNTVASNILSVAGVPDGFGITSGGEVREQGKARHEAAAANVDSQMAGVLTEFQRIYWIVNAGTASLRKTGYAW